MTGAELKATRIAAKLRQADLAVLMGVSREHLSKMETGASKINPRTLVMLRDLLKDNLLMPLSRGTPTASPKPQDPMVRLIVKALNEAGIRFFIKEQTEGATPIRLIDYNVSIAVQHFRGRTRVEQSPPAANLITIQGNGAVRMFCRIVRAFGSSSSE